MTLFLPKDKNKFFDKHLSQKSFCLKHKRGYGEKICGSPFYFYL